MNQKPTRISLEDLEVETFEPSPLGPLFTWPAVQPSPISETDCACTFTCYGCMGY